MKKFLIVTGAVAFLGVAYWLVSPLFITRRVDEQLENIMRTPTPPPTVAPVVKTPPPSAPQAMETPHVVSEGMFTGLAGHSGRGTAKLLSVNGKYYLRLENDFRVTNGPDLFVYFGKNGAYVAEARLGSLKGNEGGQNYEVPAGIDPGEFDEVWIWCRAFSVPFAKAELH